MEVNEYQDALNKYIEYYETLTPRSVRLLEKLAEPQMRFKDPFNYVEGVNQVVEIMRKMFEDVSNPKFRVEDTAWGQDGRTAFMKWVFTFGPDKDPEKNRVTGMTEIIFTHDKLVASHIDYWDAAENIYERVPVLGSILRLIKSKIAA